MKGRFAFGFAWFVVGVIAGLGIAALSAVVISNAPMPFEDKVDKVTADVDPSVALKGGVDPNAALNAADDEIAQIASSRPSSSQDSDSDRDLKGKAIEPGIVSPTTYWVQVGAYRSQDEVDNAAAALAFNGITSQTSKIANLFRLRVGPFEDRKAAEEVLSNLEELDYKPMIVEQR